RDYGYLGQRGESLPQCADALGTKAVVIADQNLHEWRCQAAAFSKARNYTESGGCVKSDPENDDVRLFREAVRDVKPMTDERPTWRRRGPAPRARFTRADRHAVLKESLSGGSDDPGLASGEELVFHRAG